MKQVIAYHGTSTKFDGFDPKASRVANDYFGGGIAYFTDNKYVVVNYASSAMNRTKSDKGYVMTANLSFQKLFDARSDAVFKGAELREIGELIGKDKLDAFGRGAGLMTIHASPPQVKAGIQYGTIEVRGDAVFKGLTRAFGSMENARKFLIRNGYDGLVHDGGQVTRDLMNTPNHNVYIAYKSEVITSVKRSVVNSDVIQKVKQKLAA